MSAIAREKTSEMSCLGAGKCPHFRNSGSLFQSFLYVFRRGAGFCPHSRGVCNSEVSARRGSTVYAREIQPSLLKKMLNVRSCLNCLTRDVG